MDKVVLRLNLAKSICEGLRLKKLLEELQILRKGFIKAQSDSQAVITIAKNPVYHDRTEHIDY